MDYYLLRHDHVVVLGTVDSFSSGLWSSIVEQCIIVVHHDEWCLGGSEDLFIYKGGVLSTL